MKLKIIYPVIYFNTLEVVVPDHKGEDLLNHSCDDENGRKGIASAFEAGYSTIKLVES